MDFEETQKFILELSAAFNKVYDILLSREDISDEEIDEFIILYLAFLRERDEEYYKTLIEFSTRFKPKVVH